MSQRGNIDYDQIKAAARQGNGSLIQMAGAGGFTNGNILIYDANGNAVDSGVTPGGTSGAAGGDLSGTYPNPTVAKINGISLSGTPSSGQVLTATGATAANWQNPSGGGSADPWLSITDPTTVTFSWRNQGGASATSRTGSIYLVAPAGSGDNIRGSEISAPSTPWSITVGIIPLTTAQANNAVGLYVSDGTKLVTSTVGSTGTSGGQGIFKYNSVTSFNSNYTVPGISYPPVPVFFKVVDDGTNLAWHYSPNGLDFIQLQSIARLNFLASVSFVGFYANASNVTWPAGVLLVSWHQGTS